MLYISNVRSDSLIERSYEYFKGLSKNVAPSLMSILNCFGEDDAWVCAKEKAGRILDSWDEEVNKQRRSWQGIYHSALVLHSADITTKCNECNKFKAKGESKLKTTPKKRKLNSHIWIIIING